MAAFLKRGPEKKASALLKRLGKTAPAYTYDFKDIGNLEATKSILSESPKVQVAVVRRAVDQISAMRRKLGRPRPDDPRYMNLIHQEGFPLAALQVVRRLLRRKLPFTEEDYVHMLNRTADLDVVSVWSVPYLEGLFRRAEKHVRENGLSKPMRAALGRLVRSLESIDNAPERKLRARIASLRGEPTAVPLEAGEAWSDAALADLDAMTAEKRSAWTELLAYCQSASGGRPSAKWTTAAQRLLDAVGRDEVKGRVLAWFPLVDKPRTAVIERWSEWQPNPNVMIVEPNAEVLKGLAWCCGLLDDKEVARALTALALSAYKKLPGIGPRAAKIGNACVCALGAMPGMEGVGQLALLKVKVKFRTAQKGIEKALTATAERVGIPRDELEEMGVPAYGLTEVGRLSELVGDFAAQLTVTGTSSTELRWIRPDGKSQKSVPAAVKKSFAEDLRELKAAAKDIQKMLPAQKERIDTLFLEQKSWPYETWRERYLDHPLIGTLARRIIWRFTAGGRTVDGIHLDGELVGADDGPIPDPGGGTVVELWHPIGQDADQVMAWRRWLEDHQVRQPFKQAHREVYILTDAERRTRIYSNRYAAHIVKQHQFNALCAVRGWKNALKLLVDDWFPPASRDLPKWDLRAEFWTDGAGDEHGVDTNDTGTFLYLATDQVRFFRLDAPQVRGHAYDRGQVETADPIPLEHVPPLVFSEIMRDIDLFVGVASVGNDPTWSDGGPEGRYREYWNGYSFGDLSQTAKTRKEVLQGLLPRLKIADRCTFTDKFLVVKGDIRTYKIHLGSSNVLMAPNDEYLCIVPGRGKGLGRTRDIFLPFEGDNTLSVILSKAFLLAEDARIKDETIAGQIRR